MNLTPHQAKYLAYELSRRGPAGSMDKIAGALADAKVDLNPHQVEAALFAFKSPLSNGAILADEGGLGKTIEAGILQDLFAQPAARNVFGAHFNALAGHFNSLAESVRLGESVMKLVEALCDADYQLPDNNKNGQHWTNRGQRKTRRLHPLIAPQ